MPATFEPITSVTLSSADTSVTFSSIPQTFTDLVLVANIIGASGGGALRMELNSDTNTNYSSTNMTGNGTSATSARTSNQAYLRGGTIGTNPTTCLINLMNYSNTTTYKTVVSRYGDAGVETSAWVNLWRNSTTGIASIKLFISSINFASGSTFSLYGIRAGA